MWRSVIAVLVLSMFVLTAGAQIPAKDAFHSQLPPALDPGDGRDGEHLLAALDPQLAADATAAAALLRSAPSAHQYAAFLGRALTWGEAIPAHSPLPAIPSYPNLVAAVEALHTMHGSALDPAQRDAIAAIGEPNAASLTRIVEAYLFQAEATRLAFSQMDDEALHSTYQAILDGEAPPPEGLPFDLGLLVAARAIAAPLVLDATGGLACDPDGDVVYSGEFQYDLRCEDSVYGNDAHLLVDVGGADRYTNNAGGGGDGLSTGPCRQPCAAMLVDVAGNDQYRPSMSVSRHFSMTGGGNGGSGMLLDLEGNDLYHMQYGTGSSRNAGVHGGAFLGTGLLFDGSGDDTYFVDLRASLQAVGSFIGGGNGGSGALIDLGGRDVYDARVSGGSALSSSSIAANGGGNFGGSGLLLDGGAADDRYNVVVTNRIAAQVMTNGAGGFGRGALLDGGGADVYTVSISISEGLLSATANGASSAGHGLLVDLGGSDAYTAVLRSGGGFNSGANGGSGGGASLLWDLDGDDRYAATGTSGTTNFFSANGGGSLGEGALIDATGNDRYTVHTTGGTTLNAAANGGGLIGSGRLYDLLGDDEYIVTGTGGGSVNIAANGGVNLGVGQSPLLAGLGLLVDGGGNDRYTDPQLDGGSCTDCTVVPKGTTGAQVDV